MIDICIVTHNNLNWLRIFVDYLFANTKDFKLYISDSGSTDRTCGYLKKLKAKYPDIVTYRHTKDNHGWTKGINWGIAQGSSPNVLIANYDIILPEKWFEKMSVHFKGNVGAVGPISDVVSGRQDFHYSYGQYEDEVELLIGFCILTKREILDKVGLLDEHYFWGHDDYDYSIRMRKAGYRLVIARDIFVKHFCYNSMSQIEAKKPELFKDGKNYTIKKHGEEEYHKTRKVIPSVVIGIPYWGDVDSDFVSSMLSLKQPEGNGAVVFARTERTIIAPARCLLAQTAIDCNSQFLLFVDSDMVFGSESLMRLMTRMVADRDRSIVGGITYKRRPPFEPCILNRKGKKWVYCNVSDPLGLYEVDGIGMGFTLIRTSVFKDLKKPYFKLDRKGMREDLNFCLNARNAGHRIFVDTAIQIGHLGERVLVDHYFKSKQLKEEE